MKKIGKIDNYNDLNKMPTLRKNNRIKSIHSVWQLKQILYPLMK